MDEAIQDILELAKTKMREAGEFSREAFEGFIEESIDYYVEKGRLSEEDDLDAIKEELLGMYNQVENEEVEGMGLTDEEFEEGGEGSTESDEEKEEDF